RAISTQPICSQCQNRFWDSKLATASPLSLHNIQHDLSASHSPFYRYSFNGVRSHFETGYSQALVRSFPTEWGEEQRATEIPTKFSDKWAEEKVRTSSPLIPLLS